MNGVNSEIKRRLKRYRIVLWVIAIGFISFGSFRIIRYSDIMDDATRFIKTEATGCSLVVAGIVIVLIIHALSIIIESFEDSSS